MDRCFSRHHEQQGGCSCAELIKRYVMKTYVGVNEIESVDLTAWQAFQTYETESA
jgi:hypothetical protein